MIVYIIIHCTVGAVNPGKPGVSHIDILISHCTILPAFCDEIARKIIMVDGSCAASLLYYPLPSPIIGIFTKGGTAFTHFDQALVLIVGEALVSRLCGITICIILKVRGLIRVRDTM